MEGQFNESIMEIHPGGKMMRFKIPPSPIDGFSVQVLNAFNTNAEIRLEQMWYIHALPLLPMPVMRSPLYNRIAYNPAQPWVPCYSDSIAMVSLLRMIYACYNSRELQYVEKNKVRIVEARNKYQARIDEIRERLQTMLNELYADNKKLNERQSLEQFAALLEYFTVEIIRTLETALMSMFGLTGNLLTPHCYPDASVLDKERIAGIPILYKHMFTAKHTILNERLKLAGHKEEVRYFHPEEIEERMKTTPKDEIYKGFIDRMTLWEYYQSLDCEKILNGGRGAD